MEKNSISKENEGDSKLFEWACNEIKIKYAELDHNIGYRFLLSPKHTLSPNTKILFLNLNPGGDCIPTGHSAESSEQGAAHLIEQWGDNLPGKNPLQIQVQKMFAELHKITNIANSPNQLLNNSLSAYFIPFRSPRYQDLCNKKESLKFAEHLWTNILKKINPEIIICMDRESFKRINVVISNIYGVQPKKFTTPIGWGNYTSDVNKYISSNHQCNCVRLNHLSTFKIFSRDQCKPYIDKIMSKISEK
jgi:hypothetical protein